MKFTPCLLIRGARNEEFEESSAHDFTSWPAATDRVLFWEIMKKHHYHFLPTSVYYITATSLLPLKVGKPDINTFTHIFFIFNNKFLFHELLIKFHF